MLFLAASTVAVLYVLSNVVSFCLNYQAASASNIPVVLCPVYPNNVIWMVASPMLRGALERFLPKFLWVRIKMAIYGWEFIDKGKAQEKYGKSFMFCTPGSNEFWTSDIEVATAVLTRRNDFLQMKLTTLFFGMFGPSLMSSNGHVWERQKRLIGPLLNERISKDTWDVAMKQTAGMLDTMSINATGNQTITIFNDLRILAFNCLLSTNFGVSRAFGRSESVREGHRLPFSEIMKSISDNIVLAALVPTKVAAFMPGFFNKIGNAKTEFMLYVTEMIQRQRTTPSVKSAILSSLVKASDNEKLIASEGQNVQLNEKSRRLYLHEDEISGNLFQFTVAGYETGANTLAYAMALLAVHFDIQEWLHDEISDVLKRAGEPANPAYEDVYHKLPRCLALMHEVLRLYLPIMHITRTTKGAQSITLQATPSSPERTILIPDNTTVYISSAAIHHDSSIWGPDAKDFRPSRWITTNKEGKEEMIQMKNKIAFLPWSGGPRLCPGMKSSQVKFVAVMVGLLREWRVVSKAVNLGMGGAEERRKRLMAIVEDSQPRIVLEMNRPQDLGLMFVRR